MANFNNLPPEVRIRLWQNGIIKSHGYYWFAQKKIKTRFQRLQKLNQGFTSKQIKKMLDTPKTLETTSSPTEQLIAISSQQPPRKEEYEYLKNKLQTNALKWIRNGKLIAVGYQVPRQATDAPIEVPIDAWTTYSPWSNNEFQLGSLKIEDVRIINPSWFQSYIEPSNITTELDQTTTEKPRHTYPRQGRPSKRHIISDAYNMAVNTGQIDFNGSKKSICIFVRELIKTKWPDEFGKGKGFGDEVIRRTITEDYERDMARHQENSTTSKL